MDAYEFAQKYRCLGAVIEWREIGPGKLRTQVVFLKFCPCCGARLPGMLTADGQEACTKCNYSRLPYFFTDLIGGI